MDDLISRDFIKSLGGECIAARDSKTHELLPISSIDALPSAQPERPKGYMKIKVISAVDGEDLFCENCDAYCLSPSYNFCPKCGVEFIGVRGEQDDES